MYVERLPRGGPVTLYQRKSPQLSAPRATVAQGGSGARSLRPRGSRARQERRAHSECAACCAHTARRCRTQLPRVLPDEQPRRLLASRSQASGRKC